jgi:hypothetical protein
MRDIRDYIASQCPLSSEHLGSPFNIKKKALTLHNFTQTQIRDLYLQHTKATGQIFEKSAIAEAWHWSEGQPWLVNALADTVVVDELKNDFSTPVTGEHFDKAAEILINRRDTHIDSLLTRLTDPRVIKVMDAVFAGTKSSVLIDSDDRQYCLDLGLVVKEKNLTLWLNVAGLGLATTPLPSGLVVTGPQPGPTGQGLREFKVRYAAS